MNHSESWNWDAASLEIPLVSWKDQFEWVEEFQASPDGESVAAIVKAGEGEFSVCVNGETWPENFDKMWYLRYSPDGRLTAIASKDGEWTLAVDGVPWENRFGYAWNTLFSEDGRHIAIAFQRDMSYGMACDDAPWGKTFPNLTNPMLSRNGGLTAAVVQAEPLNEGEIHKYQQGIYTAAIGGVPWERRFVNLWRTAFSPDGKSLAAEIRLNLYD